MSLYLRVYPNRLACDRGCYRPNLWVGGFAGGGEV